MAKYVIAKEPDHDCWFAYKKIFGFWGIFTCITASCSVKSAEDCETNLRKILTGKVIFEKEIEI